MSPPLLCLSSFPLSSLISVLLKFPGGRAPLNSSLNSGSFELIWICGGGGGHLGRGDSGGASSPFPPAAVAVYIRVLEIPHISFSSPLKYQIFVFLLLSRFSSGGGATSLKRSFARR